MESSMHKGRGDSDIPSRDGDTYVRAGCFDQDSVCRSLDEDRSMLNK